MTPRRLTVIGIVALALSLPGFWVARAPYRAAYLAAWLFCLACALGGLANVWVHTLTGGRWGEPLREPLLRGAAVLPLIAVLFIPVLLGLHLLYPWAAHIDGHRWAGDLARPEFKRWWLTPAFFVGRSIVYLAVWIVLGLLTPRARWQRSRPFAAAALLLFGCTVTLAGFDWVLSLMPTWYSTTFGLLFGTGQMLAGMAWPVAYYALRDVQPERRIFHDWGNLLLMYVLTWAYLAYTQYLVIWAANLPHEIGWYVPRVQTHWWWAAWVLILGHFFLPLLILLSRSAKRAPALLGTLAGALRAAHLLDAWWLTLPSLEDHTLHAWWFAPLVAAALLAFVCSLWTSRERVAIVPPPPEENPEPAHA
jgi:hypothetical protein